MFLAVATVTVSSFIVVNSLVRGVECAETDDDNMNVRFSARLAFPRESAMSKMNFQTESLEQMDSKARRLVRPGVIEFVETNADHDSSALNVFGCFEIPAR